MGRIWAVAIGVVALTAGCADTVSGNAVRPANIVPVGVPPLSETHVADVLLSIGELNGIVGSTRMTVTSDSAEMTDHSGDVSDPGCLGAIYGAEAPVYADSGWTVMRDQVAREPDEGNQHWVEQTAVLYPSDKEAQDFVDASRTTWQDCASAALTVDDGVVRSVWDMASVINDGSLLTQVSVQRDADGWGCQHALSAVSNLTVEAWACAFGPGGEAATIATEMAANAAEAVR
ncbi:sensor domain-containing protein [Mycolicibacterium monacense]|uniref:Sensor domain-containing protein n=2 Tax=Mycobacteriaceae TaxID=1762 RepID=A0AAD1MYN0_MYCMB|nr:sensor domain-containing protein [Mycolicibacterium monacense]ORB19128.1 sensor domain-containing protein [Mycolicibacterium monacense DSM 44395]QHP87109.1 sensor domain-containing protein [Mycolicibacterium monacense DSM 44395]BBZ59796.1 sensor domain-containing protein [Mycolicibacterium monacense]